LVEGDLAPLDGHLIGRFDADPDRLVVDLHDGDPDALSDVETLPQLPARDQHDSLLSESGPRGRAGTCAYWPTREKARSVPRSPLHAASGISPITNSTGFGESTSHVQSGRAGNAITAVKS